MVALAQVVEKEGMGDTGFEPVTSTVCGKHRKKLKRKNKRFPLLERPFLSLSFFDTLRYFWIFFDISDNFWAHFGHNLAWHIPDGVGVAGQNGVPTL